MIWYGVLGLLFFCCIPVLLLSAILQLFFRMELHSLKKRKPKKEKNIAKWKKRMVPLAEKVSFIHRVFILSLSGVVILFLVLCIYTVILQATNQLSSELLPTGVLPEMTRQM